MRNYIDIVTLTEAKADPKEMMEPLLNAMERYGKLLPSDLGYTKQFYNIFNILNSTLQTIETSEFASLDAKVWCVRILRAAACADWLNLNNDTEVPAPELKSLCGKYLNQYNKTVPDSHLDFYAAVRVIKNLIGHVVTLKYSKIANFVYGNKNIYQVFNEMTALEQEYIERSKGFVETEPGDKIVMKFPDGFVWMMLNRAYCDKEGAAMGHCGNAGAKTGQILSLREPATFEGKKGWKPSLTFILHPDGSLGEMKGRGNQKPAEKYHPYIVALLKSDMIMKVVGGGYLPKNNFAIQHLDPETQKALLDERPEFEPGVVAVGKDEKIAIQITPDLAWWSVQNPDGDYEAGNYEHAYYSNGKQYFLRLKMARKSKTVYRSIMHATIDGGVLVALQMAEHENSENYGHAVEELLLDDLVELVNLGRYRGIDDLDDFNMDLPKIYEKKPELASLDNMFKITGDTPDFRKTTVEWVDMMKTRDDTVNKWEEKDYVLYKWDNVDDFVEQFLDDNSKAYFDDDHDHYDSAVDDSEIISFFENLPLAVQIHMLEEAKSNYYDVNPHEDEDEEAFDDLNKTEQLEEYLPDEWEAMSSACHSGQEAGYGNEVHEAKIKAITDADPDFGYFEFTKTDATRNFDWDSPVYLKVTAKDIANAVAENIRDNSGENLSEDFGIEETKIKVYEGSYGFQGFDDAAALERFWEETSLDKEELTTAPDVDVTKISHEKKVTKLKELMDMIPNGMIFKRFDPDTMTDHELNHKLEQIIKQYYGK
jgi:hypothetical protein